MLKGLTRVIKWLDGGIRGAKSDIRCDVRCFGLEELVTSASDRIIDRKG